MDGSAPLLFLLFPTFICPALFWRLPHDFCASYCGPALPASWGRPRTRVALNHVDPTVCRVDRTRAHPATHPLPRGKSPRAQPPPRRRDRWVVHSRPRNQETAREEDDRGPKTKTQQQRPASPSRQKVPKRVLALHVHVHVAGLYSHIRAPGPGCRLAVQGSDLES